jgi:signal transduction histidine kinase
MTRVSVARATIDRAVNWGRGLERGTGRPLALAVLLSLVALVEVASGVLDPARDQPALRPNPFEGGEQDKMLGLVLLALLATAPVALTRTRPLSAAITVTSANYLILVSVYRPGAAALVAQLLVVFSVTRHAASWVWPLLIVPAAAYVVAPLGSVPNDAATAVVLVVATIAAGLVGSLLHAREDAAARRRSQEATAGVMLEHVASGERARIARELHDVVAHHISLISVQAETARLTTAELPPDGARRLSEIGDTARDALTEMRRLLGVLRQDVDDGVEGAPQPGLSQLVGLLDDARSASVGGARLIVRGQVVPLDPGVELTAYRIVQEALTNSRRHAPGSAVDVELDYGPGALFVTIRDSGPGASPGGDAVGGHGLIGMRERVAMLGGELVAGPGERGGFQVRASLPTNGTSS